LPTPKINANTRGEQSNADTAIAIGIATAALATASTGAVYFLKKRGKTGI
jgi:hypothetical protein